MNPLTLVKRIQNINSKEAALGISEEASWHAKYKDSAYVYAGGIPFDLTEGDLLAIFAQYGEIVDVNLVRDKGTGKSKGFAFIAYEDQRSTILAVDNLNGAQVLGRIIRVDHVSNYKKKEEEDEETAQRKREARGVCRAFQRGECSYGAGCKFSHDEQRTANTGWGSEDSRWGHDKFDGPKKSEHRFGDERSSHSKGSVRKEDRRSRRHDYSETELKSTEDHRKEMKELTKSNDNEFEPKSRESHSRRDEKGLRRHGDDEFGWQSGEEAWRREAKRSRRHTDDGKEEVNRREEKRFRRNEDSDPQLRERNETPEEKRSRWYKPGSNSKDNQENKRVRDNRSASGTDASSFRERGEPRHK